MIAKIKASLSFMPILLFVFSCAMQTPGNKNSNGGNINIGENEISKGVSWDEIITIPDDNLENVIREELNKPSGHIYKSDMEKIVILEASDRRIEKLDGIQYCINLELLESTNNNISDIKSLRNCSKIYLLDLSSNYLDYNDVYYMQDLNNLRFLYLNYNKINDLKYIKYLTDNPLDFINIENNKMSIDFDNTNRNARIIRDLLATGTTLVTYKLGNSVIGKP